MMWTTLPEEIESKIIPEPNSGCWLWTGAPTAQGYGSIGCYGLDILAHRLVYEILVKPIPDGLHIDHLCRNRICCNPEHLEPVTPSENARRGETGLYQKMRTHCPHGHPYNEANTYFNGRSRCCRTCNLLSTWRRRGKLP